MLSTPHERSSLSSPPATSVGRAVAKRDAVKQCDTMSRRLWVLDCPMAVPRTDLPFPHRVPLSYTSSQGRLAAAPPIRALLPDDARSATQESKAPRKTSEASGLRKSVLPSSPFVLRRASGLAPRPPQPRPMLELWDFMPILERR